MVKRAPQLRLLDRAALAITHAGLNTALECVARGVPMVCLPVTNDQPGVASRVEWLGLGEILPVRRVTARRLRERSDRVLKVPKYLDASARRRAELSGKSGAELAADLAARAFASGEKVRR